MKTYTILVAEDAPHYGTTDIDAADDASAIAAAKQLDIGSIAQDLDYENSGLRRVVHIENAAGNTIAHDIAIDNCFLLYGGSSQKMLCELAPELLKALQTIAEIPLYGEPLPKSMEELKSGLILSHEFDETDQTYTPCSGTETWHLDEAVGIARAVLAKAKGGAQ